MKYYKHKFNTKMKMFRVYDNNTWDAYYNNKWNLWDNYTRDLWSAYAYAKDCVEITEKEAFLEML